MEARLAEMADARSLDARIDRSIDVGLDQQICAESVEKLRQRGYSASRAALPTWAR